jgi:hypothetical protein
LVVDNVQQVVQPVATAIDDVQSVAGKMVGVESSDENADDDT